MAVRILDLTTTGPLPVSRSTPAIRNAQAINARTYGSV